MVSRLLSLGGCRSEGSPDPLSPIDPQSIGEDMLAKKPARQSQLALNLGLWKFDPTLVCLLTCDSNAGVSPGQELVQLRHTIGDSEAALEFFQYIVAMQGGTLAKRYRCHSNAFGNSGEDQGHTMGPST